ncbi:conjugative transfer ATPase [Xenorhabdus doucetiae]|uniref:conjugative transfer ATPase n=1 Tax=Xenorhabdus doucetiae TaxID=351671 RepID=UPI002B4019DA|nr:conjugative transfer ATPase [Xenorhabdus sp. 18]
MQNFNALNRPGQLREADEAAIYRANPSIIDYLPWVEYLADAQCLLLDDGISVGAVYRIDPIATEGRPVARLLEIRDQLEDAIQDSLEEDDISPWVVQFFCQDDDDPAAYLKALRDYVKPWAKGTPFTDAFLAESAHHLNSIARPEGIFQDSLITGQPWRGQQRQTRMVVYRWLPATRKSRHDSQTLSAVTALNQVCGRLVSSLAAAGVVAHRQNGEQIHSWLLRHFNPAPDWGMAKADFYRTVGYETATPPDLPVNNDFAESLWFNPPVSDPESGVWWFDGLPHKAVPVERLRRPPEPGALTGEVKRGDNINALMDMMPEGTVVSLTIVAQAQDRLEEDFTRLAKNAVGENTESLRVRQDVQEVRELLGRWHKLYRSALTFLVRGRELDDINHRVHQLSSTLLTAGLQPVRPEFSVSPLNTYLRALPMCFNPQKDQPHWHTRLSWVQHLTGLLPVTGRSTGTGHPGFSFFNRGGAPLTFDPMNKQDRTQNAHLLLFGPTGAGKSATLCASLIQLMAIHRPRLFIVEAGNSFGLLADYYQSLGLTVNKIGIKPGCGVSLALFADAHQLLQLSPNQLRINEADIPETDEAQEEGDEQRDILGEMEIAARLMITGGEKKEEERLTRSDRGLIREAIMMAAQTSFDEARQMIASDLQNALYAIARNHQQDEHGQPLITAHRRARADEMAGAMSMFTQGFEGELFNRPGTPWPEVDVTLIDLGTLARENYSAQMALAMVSLINKVNNLAERDQYQDRELQLVIDEGHITTTNPLLSPYIAES